MTKEERAARLKDMLQSLGNEHQYSCGFNEFSQFCEEWLADNLAYLSEEGLKNLMDNIEDTSALGITRRTPSPDFQKESRKLQLKYER